MRCFSGVGVGGSGGVNSFRAFAFSSILWWATAFCGILVFILELTLQCTEQKGLRHLSSAEVTYQSINCQY